MSSHDMIFSRFCLFAALFALALAPTSACAKDETVIDEGMTVSQNDAALPAFPTAPAPQMAMAPSASGSDALANFGPSSGTVIGNRAAALRDEVLRLRSSVNLDANEFAIMRSTGAAGAVQYHSMVAAITARLQNGTTKGNPILLRQWQEAEASLSEVTQSLTKLNSLQVAIDADASVASYLLESVQAAFQLSGAVDEDHDQLKLLRDEISRLVVQLDYLRNETTADINRQSNYLTTERANIQALAFAISRGEMVGSPARPAATAPIASPVSDIPPAPQAAPMAAVTQGEIASAPSQKLGHLLVLIRFNQPHVDYAQQLSQAYNLAIERRPNAEFVVVSVSPATGDSATMNDMQQQAKTYGDEVARSLMQLGLAPERIGMGAAQSESAETPEVHVYIR